jgi:hypothetical protein
MSEIEIFFKQAQRRIDDHIEMLYIQAKSRIEIDEDPIDKKLDERLILEFLRKRGYTMINMLGKKVMFKGFVCVFTGKQHIEVWHDIPNSKGSCVISESLLTGLPITLDYMEKLS